MEVLNEWFWLIIMVVGLLLALIELFAGVDTQLDLVFIGSSFIIGGLITWPFKSWVLTLILSGVICIAYVAIGRRYIHKWTTTKKEMTNIDAIIGKKGTVTRDIDRNNHGQVKIGAEQWRAIAQEEIKTGTEIEVIEVKGVTLTVKKTLGGGN